MKRLALVFWGIGSVLSASAQTAVFNTTRGEATFVSSGSMDNISAKNERVISIFDTRTREITVRVPVAFFSFPNKLMQQHFNERFMESNKYPFATFKGRIVETFDFSIPGRYPVSARGEMTMHGVTQKKVISGTLVVSPGGMELQSSFPIQLADYKISIPKDVVGKVANSVTVNCRFSYQPFQKN